MRLHLYPGDPLLPKQTKCTALVCLTMKNVNKLLPESLKLTLSQQMFSQPIPAPMEKQLALDGFLSRLRGNNILKEDASEYSKISPPPHAEVEMSIALILFLPSDSPA